MCGGGERAVWVSYRERSCTVLMKKAVQLDGEPSVSASPGGVHYYTSLLAYREKIEFILIALLCNCDQL